jgi:predicted transglutaminase-like cysteine proteinase
MSVLDDVFYKVSDKFVYATDLSVFGQQEYWANPKEQAAQANEYGRVRGDCDDFALMCRTGLDDLGIENHLVFCQVGTGDYNLVCESNGWILDCRQSQVMPRTLLNYKWIARSGRKAGDKWHELERV